MKPCQKEIKISVLAGPVSAALESTCHRSCHPTHNGSLPGLSHPYQSQCIGRDTSHCSAEEVEELEEVEERTAHSLWHIYKTSDEKARERARGIEYS